MGRRAIWGAQLGEVSGHNFLISSDSGLEIGRMGRGVLGSNFSKRRI